MCEKVYADVRGGSALVYSSHGWGAGVHLYIAHTDGGGCTLVYSAHRSEEGVKCPLLSPSACSSDTGPA